METSRSRSVAHLRNLAALVLGVGASCVALVSLQGGARPALASPSKSDSSGCLTCHAGIEEMHPEAELTCVDCHGGDGAARTKAQAHPPRAQREAGDEREAGKPLTERLDIDHAGGVFEVELWLHLHGGAADRHKQARELALRGSFRRLRCDAEQDRQLH